MRARLGVLILALTAGSMPLTADGPAQDLPTFRASVELVPISAVVRDRRGRLVTNLKVADFEVLDHGERRSIVDFQVDETGPVTLALLLDISGSMSIGRKMMFARQVLERTVAELGHSQDEAALFTFDRTLREELEFTPRPVTLGSVVDHTEPFGTTSLHDAIAATARRVAERPTRRRAIVVVTDGIDTSSALSSSEVSAIASSIDVPVYVVITASPIDRARYMNQLAEGAAGGASDLLNLAQWTGGDLLFASAADQPPSIARQIVNELRHQYVLAIESAGRSEWRRLNVRVRNHRLSVAARSGYFGRDANR